MSKEYIIDFEQNRIGRNIIFKRNLESWFTHIKRTDGEGSESENRPLCWSYCVMPHFRPLSFCNKKRITWHQEPSTIVYHWVSAQWRQVPDSTLCCIIGPIPGCVSRLGICNASLTAQCGGGMHSIKCFLNETISFVALMCDTHCLINDFLVLWKHFTGSLGGIQTQ